MPPTEAVVVTPDGKGVDLGSLDVQQRKDLEAAVDAAANVPVGAPAAGFGGASTGNGVDDAWLAAGAALLAASGLTGFALWRRRRST